jgi:hypothetical protein
MAERLVLVAGLGVVIAFLLSSKEYFHSFASKVSRDDFYATVKFLIVAVIALPLLPDRDVGPLDAINPRNLGLMVVTISGLSFLGYVAMRLWGAKRGLLLGAALGGLVSSTAVTLSFANRTKADPRLAPVAAGAIAVAWTIMLGRVAVLVALIDAELLQLLAFPLVAMILAALVGLALTFHRNAGQEPSKTELTNPFELGSAIKVSLMFALVLVVTKGAIHYLGDRGLYLAAALSGTTDVDARDRVDGEASRLPGQCPGRDHGDLHRHRGQHAGQDRARGGHRWRAARQANRPGRRRDGRGGWRGPRGRCWPRVEAAAYRSHAQDRARCGVASSNAQRGSLQAAARCGVDDPQGSHAHRWRPRARTLAVTGPIGGTSPPCPISKLETRCPTSR